MHALFRIASSVSIALLLSSQTCVAHAAEIKVLGALGMKAAIEDIALKFERATAHKLTVTFLPLGAMVKLVRGGEAADVVITPQQGMEGFAKDGKVIAGSIGVLARSGMVVAVRKGAPKPDISSPEAFKRALLAAKSITYGRGAGSEHIEEVLDRLGIANDVKSKIVRGNPGDTGVRVAKGEAEIGVTFLSVLIPVAGIEIVGPLPGDLQHTQAFSAAIMVASKQPATSKEFIDFFRTPEARNVLKANGMEPG